MEWRSFVTYLSNDPREPDTKQVSNKPK